MSFFNEIDKVWDEYIGQIERYIVNNTHEPLQLYSLSRALPVDFDKYPLFSNGLLNRESDLVTGFGATFAVPDLENNLEAIYGDFLIAIASQVNFHHMSPTEKQKQKDLEGALEDSRTALDNFSNMMEARWTNYKAIHHIPDDDKLWLARQQWERRFGYNIDINLRENDVSTASAELWAFIASMTSPQEVVLKTALSYWNDPTNQEAFPPGTGYEHDPDLGRWGKHRPQTIGGNWTDFYGNDDVRQLLIDEHENLSTDRQTNWNGNGGWSGGFVSVNVGGGGGSEEKHFNDHVRKVEISFKRLEEIQIIRGPWFQNKLFSTYGASLKGWWGPDGLLPCYPVSVILSRGLKMTLYVDNIVHDIFNSHTEGSGGVSIGPWHIGGGGGGSTSIDQIHEAHDSYTIEDKPELARIIGVRVARPNFHAVSPDDFPEFLAKSFEERERARGA